MAHHWDLAYSFNARHYGLRTIILAKVLSQVKHSPQH